MAFLLRPLSFLGIILGAYGLKCAGLFQGKDAAVMKKIVLNITLPAAVLHAFDGYTRDAAMYALVALGFLCSFLPSLALFWLTRGQDKARRAYKMVNVSGYNIGSFALPLIQHAFGAPGAAIAIMFDTGNAVMQTGGSYALTSAMLGTGSVREGPLTILKKFLSSVSFDTYLLMIILVSLDIRLPPVVLTLTAPIASANSFCAMLMLGLMFEPARNAAYLRDAAGVIGIRLLFGAAFSAAILLLTPFALPVRQVLAVLCFAPISSLAPVNTERCGGDGALSSFTNSISVLLALASMTAMVALLTG